MLERVRPIVAPIVIGGVFVILAGAAVVAGVVDFSTDVGEPNHSTAAGALMPLTIWAVIFGLATYKTLTGRLFAGRRWAQIDEELRTEGFRSANDQETKDTAGIRVHLLDPSVLAMDRGGGIDHVAVGRVAGREVRSFRARLRGGHHWIDVSAVAVRIPASFAPTMIRRAARHRRKRNDTSLVRFELERFNRSIEVHSADRFFASALIDARMMEWLSHHLRRTTIELADGWVVAWSGSLRGSPLSPIRLIDLLVRFSAQIPRPIPSLFPRSSLQVKWIHKRKHTAFSAWLERLSDEPKKRVRASPDGDLP